MLVVGLKALVVEVHEDDVDMMPFGCVEFADWPLPGLRDRLAVMFTSGTTGVPKGVEITQANYAFAGKVMAEAAGLQSHHRQIVVLPLFHANAQYYSFASAIWAGASVALMHTFSASQFCAQASPQTTSGVSQTGTRVFGITEDGVLRGEVGTAPKTDRASIVAMTPIGN